MTLRIGAVTALCVLTGGWTLARVTAQAPARGAAPPEVSRGAGGSGGPDELPVDADMLQLMRGLFFPTSNVIFAAQNDLAVWTPARQPSASPNPLTGLYGGWPAVEYAALTLAESARLLLVPGRACANGNPVPVERDDWIRFSEDVRTAARSAYTAAQSRQPDAMLEASTTLTEACGACHRVYRAGGAQGRCVDAGAPRGVVP